MSMVKNQYLREEWRDAIAAAAVVLHDAGDGFGQLSFQNRLRLFKLEVHLVGVGYHAGLVFGTVALLRAGLQPTPDVPCFRAAILSVVTAALLRSEICRSVTIV
jgi:hypothetical protein